MVIQTKVINSTTEKFILKEGTGGIYRRLVELAPEKSYTISVDPSATYREYWCATKDNDPKAVILSSDDCQEYSVVRIIKNPQPQGSSDQEPSYIWEGDLRDQRARNVLEKAVPQATNPEEPSNENFIVRFGKKWAPGFFKQGNAQS